MTSHGLIVYRKKILLILRDDKPDIPYPDYWAPLGGNAQGNELPEETLKRELKEEGNLDIKKFTYLGDMAQDAHLFLVKVTDKMHAKIQKGKEGQKLGYFDFDKLFKIHLATKFKNFIEEHKEKLRKLL